MPNQQQLDLFFDNLPRKPYAGACKSGTRVMTLEHAIKQAYIQHNQPKLAHWLVFDVDHHDVYRFYDLNLPAPNYIAINPGNGHYHAAYAIVPVCTSENANMSNLRLLALVERAYQVALGADPSYAGLLSKNPLSDRWLVWVIHDEVVDLHYLTDFRALDLDAAAEELWGKKRQHGPRPAGFGRHCHLFDVLRFWAYGQVASYGTYEAFFGACLDKAERFNDYPEPLPFSHVKSTAKSVSRWTWQRREEFTNYKQVDRGVMGLQHAPLTLSEKQSAASARTGMIRKDKTEKAILEAIETLQADNKRVTKAAVAKMVGITDRAIRKHYPHLFQKTGTSV